MFTSKIKWMRLITMCVAGLLAFSPLAHVQIAKAIGPVGSVGVSCTAGAPDFELTAKADYIMMPDMNTMYMWSYGAGNGTFQHPGPTLCVHEGDVVTVTLHNQLPYGQATSIVFPGQDSVQRIKDGDPTYMAAQPELASGSLTTSVVNGGTITYKFTATHAGTFIYESGTDTKTQVPMGLFGALIVRPKVSNVTYDDYAFDPVGDATTSSQFVADQEFMALLSEVDPYQHAAWELGATQGRAFDLNNYRARYWLINGRGFPDSIADNNVAWLPNQPYGSLARIYPSTYALERFINVGSEEYPFHPHGQNGAIIGRDGYQLVSAENKDLSFEKFAVNIGPGQTWDVRFSWHDAENYNPVTNPVPLSNPSYTNPDLANLTLGMFYSGSPYLGEKPTLPPGASTLNQCGEYYIISHNHALFQLDAFGQTMAGPITYLRVDPPMAQQDATGLHCN